MPIPKPKAKQRTSKPLQPATTGINHSRSVTGTGPITLSLAAFWTISIELFLQFSCELVETDITTGIVEIAAIPNKLENTIVFFNQDLLFVFMFIYT